MAVFLGFGNLDFDLGLGLGANVLGLNDKTKAKTGKELPCL